MRWGARASLPLRDCGGTCGFFGPSRCRDCQVMILEADDGVSIVVT